MIFPNLFKTLLITFPYMAELNPVKYAFETMARREMSMIAVCDGRTFYKDGREAPSVSCPAESKHIIHQSQPWKGKTLVTVTEPDMSRPTRDCPAGKLYATQYIVMVLEEGDDVHESRGLYSIIVGADGDVKSTLSKSEPFPAGTGWQKMVDFMIEEMNRDSS